MSIKKSLPVFIIALLAISGYLIYKKLNPKKLPPYLVEAVGRISADVVNLNAKYPGRIATLSVDTGDKIKKGEIVAKLNSKEFNDKLNALNKEIDAKKAELKLTRKNVEISINKASINIKAKKAEIKALQAKIDSLKDVIAQDKRDEKRIASLVKRKLAKEHELELAKLKTKTDTKKLSALLAQKEALIQGLEAAKQNYELALASKNKVKALQKAIEAMEYKKAEIQTIINELTLTSPVDGFIDTKIANIGEVVGAGMPVVSIIDTSSYYLKIYVDELTNGKIKLNQQAEIFLDSFPDKPIKAKVVKIAKRAEFTPKEVAVRSDRITRVYEVHLKPIEPNPYLKLGLPATGVVLIGNGSLPKSLREIPEI
ncbi:MAG: HlyD family efflux transporter periplasmic adaptor subunit [Epsilonproteobacteria bacterium]|nr:HlyD family efflux transporter periplasmic adaptor subunit [Campylobacterota bacterium]